MIYLAGPLFTSAERHWNYLLANNLRSYGYEVALPQEFCKDIEDPSEICGRCLKFIDASEVVVANCDGIDVDSGTAMEFGYGLALEKVMIGYRTDFRRAGDCEKNVNLMIAEKSHAFIYFPFGTYSHIGRAISGHIERLL